MDTAARAIKGVKYRMAKSKMAAKVTRIADVTGDLFDSNRPPA